MSLRKRGNIWWIRFTDPNGRRIYLSAQTSVKIEAQELHDKLKSEAWRLTKLEEKPKRIWQDAVIRWLKEQAHKATHEEDKSKLRWLDKHLAGKKLDAINRALIDKITEAKLAEGCSNATVNRHLALLRAILRKCVREWEWLPKAPSVWLLQEPKRRIRFLTKEQAHTLLAELPEHLREMATFTLSTGLRAANVTGLTWQQVDIEGRRAWIYADQAKARRAIAVPLNGTAIAVLERQTGKHPVRVFTYAGNPVEQVSTKAWYNALKRAGIADFRWHDLRHSWASWHAQAGTPLHVLQELGAWESVEMVRRYAHLAVSHLAAYADRVEVGGTNLGHPQTIKG